MRIYVYSRKSVWTGKGESIENQVKMCREYLTSRIDGGRDAEIVVYEDEGFSGKNLDRPQFQKMLADSKKQKPDVIVCYRLDRISRSVGDFAPLAEDFISRDIGFICIKEQFDTSTPMGKAMMYIASVFAQLERETIAERSAAHRFSVRKDRGGNCRRQDDLSKISGAALPIRRQQIPDAAGSPFPNGKILLGHRHQGNA